MPSPTQGFQLVDVPFAGGMSQSIADEHVPVGRLVDVRNARITRDGRLSKRNGNVVLTSAALTAIDTPGTTQPIDSVHGCKMYGYRNELVVASGGSVGSWSPALGCLTNKDKISEAIVQRSPVTNASTSSYTPDVAIGNGVIVYVWLSIIQGSSNTYEILCSVVDAATGSDIISNRVIKSGDITPLAFPRVVYGGGVFSIWYKNDTNQLRALVLDDDLVFGTDTLITDTVGMFDVQPNGSVPFTVVISTFDGTGEPFQYTLLNYSASLGFLTLAAYVEAAGEVGNPTLAISGDRIWLGYWTADGLSEVSVSAYHLTTLAQTMVPTVVGSNSDPVATIALCQRSSDTVCAAWTFVNDNTGRIAATVVQHSGTILVDDQYRTTFWAWLGSRMFSHRGRFYVWSYVGANGYDLELNDLYTLPWSLVLLDLNLHFDVNAKCPARPVAVSAARVAALELVSLIFTDVPPSVVALGNNMPHGVGNTQYVSVGRQRLDNAGRAGIAQLVSDFGERSMWQGKELVDTLHFSGGLPSYYDATKVSEIGFTYYPARARGAAVYGGGIQQLAPGRYYYRVTYEWIDARGNRHRSTPSEPIQVDVEADDGGEPPATLYNTGVNLTIPSYCVTRRQDYEHGFFPKVQIVVYRTIASAGITPEQAFQQTYYRLFTDIDSANINTMNDPTVENKSYTDIIPDTLIQTHETLYTNGGALDNVNPPSAWGIAARNDRLQLIGDDRRTVYFSKQAVVGEAIAFAGEFTIPFNEGERLVAIAAMDDKWVYFSATRIYFLQGEGPLDTGLQNDYGTPFRLACDVGCVDANSVVLTPEGLIFRGRAGFYLLSRGLDVAYISRDIQQIFIDTPSLVVTSATLHPRYTWAMFTFDEDDNVGRRAVYDYQAKAWYLDSMRSNVMAACTRNGSAVNFIDLGTLVAPPGLWSEDLTETIKTDDGAWVTMSATLPTVKTTGIQGWQRVHRVKLLANRVSSHDVNMQLKYDYGLADAQHVYLAATIDAIPGKEQLELQAVIQKCSTISAIFSDAQPTGVGIGNGAGGEWLGVTFEVDPITDSKLLPAAQKA